ncbi:CCR4-NOT transcription complex subunit 4 [Ophiocordyceps camponoti-floridani]|uniref:CCR4-NOT transcription complex subunit 4 n=1 Tax=Ophiocordyceps camponoti-floridani TaxID=2030778 RepID=A0A8H4QDX4_9HYPO|nr:CCR4-NOT transcription complex subunit 4 [Ophiocordyceps camponoti-floridani]
MAPQDSFIEEEEDVCPLCIEEFDLSDRNFRPCPCGYQVCQFCFNNIKNNMNGLCPACRRPYDEKTIQWKVVTQEEVAEFRANIQKNQKKRAQEQKQKEVQKREAEKENRKSLIGVRVVQKNLVYITGLTPTVREDELLKTLRKHEFFGQYGAIQKISISNRRSSDGQYHTLGIYVTFEKPEEAARCIQAVHGSLNGDRVLKAQYGTTKYCSAWLKHEKCNNPGCMFLHEQGDEEDSYTRQDLSSMNSIHTQRPLPAGSAGSGSSSRGNSRQQNPQPTPPPAPQPLVRSASKDGSENGADSSALPSSASWARSANPQRSRRGSHATSGAASSPAVSTSLPAATEVAQQMSDDADSSSAKSRPADVKAEPTHRPDALNSSLRELLKTLGSCTIPRLARGQGGDLGPPMFDIRGGDKRRVMREEEDSRAGDAEELVGTQAVSEGEAETGGGSHALGGEPEEGEADGEGHNFDPRQVHAQPPIQRANTDGVFGSALAVAGFGQGSANSMGRALTPQQLASLRPQQQSGFGEQMAGQAGLFQAQGHNRQSSRFSFANDNAASATNVKVSANSRIMSQQASMMPNSFQSQNQFYGSSMPGPPPGLKSTGTPPSMFGQSFGGSGFGAAPKDSSNDLLQNLIGRNRGGGGGGQPHEAGKLDLADPSILQARMQHQTQSNAGVSQGLFGGQSQGGYNMMYNASYARW